MRDSKEAARGPGPASTGTNVWQAIAIIALLAATAGWTTVAVIALRGSDAGAGAPLAQSSASPSDDPDAVDEESAPPIADTHDAPDLEAALPGAVNGVDLQTQSVTGSGLLTDDEWSTSVTTFLTGAGKTAADLQFAQAYDPAQSIDGSFEVYRVAGIEGTKLRDALVNAWKGDFPDLKLTDVTVGGQKMVRGEFDADTPASYLYVRGDEVFDIWTNDEKVAAAAIAALPAPGATARPRASASAAASVTPGASTAP
ncbi:MAG: hypothetical protein ACJ77I_09570 [Chloroflexota bacterium]